MRFNFFAVGLGFIFQTAFLSVRGHALGRCPLTNLFEVFIFLAWSVALMRPQPYRGQPGIAGQSQKTQPPPGFSDPSADADMVSFTYSAWVSLLLRPRPARP